MVVTQNLVMLPVNGLSTIARLSQVIETGKDIHHKMCRHGGKHMVKVWILNDKSKKSR